MKPLYLIFFFVLALTACRRGTIQENSNFPPDVQLIFTNKCATAGCHNAISATNAANLNLTSWEAMFQGSVNGTVAIPYASFQSSLMQFINTYDDLGLKTAPSMPLNMPPLSRDEVIAVKNWINAGCPNSRGEFPFPGNPVTKAKAYISNQGCDLVSIVDADTRLVMRCVRVGADSGIVEQPHNIKLAPDGKHWYVCFSNGSVVQKFDAVGDTLVGQVDITYGKWNVITFTQDSKTAFVSDLSNNGRIAEVDLTTMTLKRMYASGLFSNPHGMAVTLSGDTVYATAQYGNMIYRIIRSIPKVDQISLEKGVAPSLTPNLLDPHEILIHEGKRQYYVTCQASNQVFVMDASADTVIKKIDVGVFPLEMALSPSKNLLFITCQEDPNPVNPFFKGSVYVINLNTLTVTKTIYEKFYQPHGIALDDKRGHLYVASTNGNPTGPAPHHASECAGRNGFFHVIDIQTWKTIRNASEVSVFPYSVAVKE